MAAEANVLPEVVEPIAPVPVEKPEAEVRVVVGEPLPLPEQLETKPLAFEVHKTTKSQVDAAYEALAQVTRARAARVLVIDGADNFFMMAILNLSRFPGAKRHRKKL